MIKTQISQIAAAILANHTGKILGQQENSPEFVHTATEQQRRRSLADGL